jgi:hypothetical protein
VEIYTIYLGTLPLPDVYFKRADLNPGTNLYVVLLWNRDSELTQIQTSKELGQLSQH